MTNPAAMLDAATGELVRRLRMIYEPDQIWLFGSRARGDARPDSDWDLLVVVPDDAPPRAMRARRSPRSVRWLPPRASGLDAPRP